ncbi:MAG: iron chelate uptake ABC transporter family permease subunit [Bacteroidota bacterium]
MNPTILWALAAIVCMTAASAIMGTFTLLRKQALIGDAVSHAILPGICLAFMITQTKHPLVLMLGATASGFLGLLAINYLTDKTKLKNDASLAIVLSVFYGLGILLLTSIQSSGNAAQAGLDKFLFGKAAALMQGDAITFAVFGLVLIGIVVWLFRPFKLITFDRDFAQSQGLPVRKLELLLSILTVSAIALGIQAVGVVLMAALLIAPAAAARYWTHDLRGMLLLSVLFAIVSGILGVYVSATYPNIPFFLPKITEPIAKRERKLTIQGPSGILG